MATKAPVTTPMQETTSGGNTSIAGSLQDADLQLIIIGRLKEIVEQIKNNQTVFNNKLKSIGLDKIKMPSVKRFNRIKTKLKGYLIQMTLKLRYKKDKIGTAANAVIYTGLFLTG